MDNTEAAVKCRNFGAAQVGAALNEYLWVWIGGPAGGGAGRFPQVPAKDHIVFMEFVAQSSNPLVLSDSIFLN